jgi:hypothetical protein
MKESQYAESYLRANSDRLARGQGAITIGTYLHYTLRGRRKDYVGRYERALKRSLIRRGAIRIRSVRGRDAYILADIG